MTVNPPTIDISALCGDVVERMRTMKTGHLPVLREGRLVGIVTRSDVMRAFSPPVGTPSPTGFPACWGKSVGEVMTKNPIVVQSDVPAEQAARVLNEREIQAMPVVDGSELVGLVTSRDLASALAHLLGADIKGVRMTVDLPDELHNLRQLVDAITSLKPALFPLTLAVRLDRLEHRARLRIAAPRPLLVAETLAMEGVHVVRVRFDPPTARPQS
jgi:CBS domain-containing protein